MIEYKIIKELSENPRHTQRSLAQKLDVSLGKINYVLSGLAGKGIIKAKKLRDHPERIRWQYNLTPKGVKEKARITKRYLESRLLEFNAMQVEIEELRKEVERTAK